MIPQAALKEFEREVQEKIDANGGIGFVDLESLAFMPQPFAIRLLELIKEGKVKIIMPGPNEIL